MLCAESRGHLAANSSWFEWDRLLRILAALLVWKRDARALDEWSVLRWLGCAKSRCRGNLNFLCLNDWEVTLCAPESAVQFVRSVGFSEAC